jgi:hypothetical protein
MNHELDLSPKRHADESYEDYCMRRKFNNWYLKWYLRGYMREGER